MAVESEDVAYIAQSGADTVSKTINAGFTWGTAEDTKLAGGNTYTITSIGEDMLVVGSTTGYVAYSTDGNDSWSKISRQIGTTATNVRVTADGLTDGGNIYAGHDAGLSRWTIGTPVSEPWTSFEAVIGPPPPGPITIPITGVVLQAGTLYASGSSVIRHTAPFLPDPPPPGDAISAGGRTFDTAPTALSVISTDTSNKIFGVDTATNMLYSYEDTLVATAPTVIGPPDGLQVSINPISGFANDVNFTWNSVLNVSIGDTYGLHVTLDERGDEGITPGPDGMSVGAVPGPVVSQLVGPSVGTTSADGHIVYLPGTTYYWKVRVTAPIKSPWSEVRSFTIEASTALSPTVGSPANGGTVYDVPAFSWSPVTATTKYRFELCDDTVFAVPLYAADVTSTGIKPDITLGLGTYFWRVKALEPVPGEWSTIANFTVAEPVEAAPPPEVVIPPQPPPTVNVPDIVVPPPEVVVQPPVTEPTTSEGLLWAVIIIGAVLVIALIVLIVRTRRSV
jgi:hypothetical protein